MKLVVAGVLALAVLGCGKKDDKTGPGGSAAAPAADKDAMLAKARALVKSPPTGEAKPFPAGIASRDNAVLLSSDPAQTDAMSKDQVSYAVVMTVIEATRPQIKDDTKVVAGSQIVEARLYDIAANKYLGGAVIRAESSPAVLGKAATQKVLDDDLDQVLLTALDHTMANGNPEVASPPDWKRIAGKGISASVPPTYQLLPYKASVPARVLSFVVNHDTDAKETLDFFIEPDATKFATDADCAARIAGYASELSAKVTSAKVEDGMCVGDLDRAGKRRTRVRYWAQYGAPYSVECEGPSSTAGFTQQCDIMWASRAFK